jgi:hypothetical protein
MKRLVLFVEGEGEAEAVPALVKRIINGQGTWPDDIVLDSDTFRVGAIGKLAKDHYRDWKRFLGTALKRQNVGGILLILDGDTEKLGGKPFCAATIARSMAVAAQEVGAGETFSVAVVFALQEYETWLIAGVTSFAGQRLADGRLVAAHARPPYGDLEASPRDAKGWLRGMVEGGYKPTRDQAALTHLVDIGVIRERNLRSFRRLESALSVLTAAMRLNKPIASPP